MKKLILALKMLIISILPQKPIEKRVLEKVNIVKPIRKKKRCACKKTTKKGK